MRLWDSWISRRWRTWLSLLLLVVSCCCTGCGEASADNEDHSCDSVEGVGPEDQRAEVCDGLDNDCDGQVDESVEPASCELAVGVCDGAKTDRCVDQSYAVCGPRDYGPDYTSSPAEAWRCDGLDNDCDGNVDEVCCGAQASSTVPEPADLRTLATPTGPSSVQDRAGIAIATARPGAPDGAVALVAMLTPGKTVRAFHVDRTGQQLGSAWSDDFSSGSPITPRSFTHVTDVALAPSVRGYELVVSGATFGSGVIGGGGDNGFLQLQGLRPDLSADGSSVRYGATNRIWSRLSIASNGERIGIAGLTSDVSNSVSDPDVRLLQYRAVNRLASVEPVSLPNGIVRTEATSIGSTAGELVPVPVLRHQAAAGFAMLWINRGPSSSGRLNVVQFNARFDPSNAAVQNSLQFAPDEPTYLDFEWRHSGELVVVHEAGSGLEQVTVRPADGTVPDRVSVSERGMSPSLFGTDTDSDGWSERLTVLAQVPPSSRTSDSMTAIRSANGPLGDVSLGDDATELRSGMDAVRDLDSRAIRLPNADGYAVVWRETGSSNSQPTAQFIPVSREGVGICRPEVRQALE